MGVVGGMRSRRSRRYSNDACTSRKMRVGVGMAMTHMHVCYQSAPHLDRDGVDNVRRPLQRFARLSGGSDVEGQDVVGHSGWVDVVS